MGKKEMRMSRLVEIINSRGYIPIKAIPHRKVGAILPEVI